MSIKISVSVDDDSDATKLLECPVLNSLISSHGSLWYGMVIYCL